MSTESILLTASGMRGAGKFREAITYIFKNIQSIDDDLKGNAWAEAFYAAKEAGWNQEAREYAKKMQLIDPNIPSANEFLAANPRNVFENLHLISDYDRNLVETTILEALAGVSDIKEFENRMKGPIRRFQRGAGFMAWLMAPDFCRKMYVGLHSKEICCVRFNKGKSKNNNIELQYVYPRHSGNI